MTTLRIGAPAAVEIRLRKSRRARRLTLRVSAIDGQVTLTMPMRVPEAEARAFAETRLDWIRNARAAVPTRQTLEPGVSLPVEGVPHRLAFWDRARVETRDGVLVLPASRPGRAAARFLRERARDRFNAAASAHAGRLGVDYTEIAIRDPRSRWGSCSAAGRLMFSWRLILAPAPVLDYVAAHEVAHRAHMDHSPAFWGVVETAVPDWRTHRAWLRSHGGALHAYRFED